ncbi:MAG: ABC transporter ATP-binding protein [Candidatus Heimdallarchaeota archaeon]|nr:MAG: ABC transporter ATP-binding protein [Candidatus Heimdallarchaeota archaeon]
MQVNHKAEFLPEKDRFIRAREKGPRQWIIAHMLIGSNKLIVLAIFMGTILTATMNSGLMVIIGIALDEFTRGEGSNLLTYAILFIVFAVGSPILNLITNIIRETLAQRMEKEARHEFYVNLLGKSQSFHDSQRIGDVMARATNDVRMLNFMISPGLSLIFESFMNLITPILFIAILYPSELLLAPFLFTVLFIITLRGYTRKLGPVSDQLRFEFGQMNTILNETLSGIEVVKGSTTEEYEMNRYLINAQGYRDAFVLQGKIMAKYIPVLLIGLAITLGLGHGILLFFSGRMTVGMIISYVGLISNLRFPTFISIWVFALIKLAVSGAERLLDIMEKESDIDENIHGVDRTIDGLIKFENVSFKYPGSSNKVLSDVSFAIAPGQTVAIVGTTGSGKTTLTKLLSRLYDPDDGQILIDGKNIKEWKLESLRNQISYIEQDTFLFSDKIAENISFGQTSSLEEIKRVAKEAQADTFIEQLPNGYESEVGERGVQLSGGQRQRIAIARAFLTDPRILILDDSTSAIDSDTEDKIQRAMTKILSYRTTFLITHRLSQIRWADLILVMKKGEIIAKGTHEKLMKTSEEYRKIFVKRFDLDERVLLEEAVV